MRDERQGLAHALEGLGRTSLHDGNLAEAAAYLEQAHTIYQRIGAPGARRIEDTLQHHQITPTARHWPVPLIAKQPAASPDQ